MSKGQPREEARHAPRVAVDAFVKVQGQDREYILRTRDLSQNGLFLYTKVHHIYPFKVGSTLTLELYDYDTYVKCRAVVVRVVEAGSTESGDYPTGFGLRIVEIADDAGKQLANMIHRVGQAGELY